MTFIYAVAGVLVFVLVAGIVGYKVADFMDKKYGSDDS